MSYTVKLSGTDIDHELSIDLDGSFFRIEYNDGKLLSLVNIKEIAFPMLIGRSALFYSVEVMLNGESLFVADLHRHVAVSDGIQVCFPPGQISFKD